MAPLPLAWLAQRPIARQAAALNSLLHSYLLSPVLSWQLQLLSLLLLGCRLHQLLVSQQKCCLHEHLQYQTDLRCLALALECQVEGCLHSCLQCYTTPMSLVFLLLLLLLMMADIPAAAWEQQHWSLHSRTVAQ